MSGAVPPRGMPDRIVWMDGRLLPGRDAAISLFDRGARDRAPAAGGSGLIETFRVEDRKPLHWQAHLERLVVSAAELGFPVPPAPEVLRAALDQVLDANQLRDAAVRLTVTRGIPGGRPPRTSAWIEVEPLESRLWAGTRRGSARAVFSKNPFEPVPLGRHKTMSRLAYDLAREQARAERADEAILVNRAGQVLEGATSNVFAVSQGEVLTPPLALGILPGTVRALTLEACRHLGLPARERQITREGLMEMDEVFLTNALQEVVPVGWLAGREFGRAEIAERIRGWVARPRAAMLPPAV